MDDNGHGATIYAVTKTEILSTEACKRGCEDRNPSGRWAATPCFRVETTPAPGMEFAAYPH